MSLPKTMKAVVSGGPGKAEVKEVPLPNISTDEVLVKIAYAASNPTDWKHLDSLSPAGAILGCDFAGTVVQVGADVKGVSKGDKVGTFVHGGKFEDKGSYAEYAKVPSDMLLDLNGVDLKEGVTFGIGYITAAMAIFYHQKNEYPPAKRDGGWFLVQGGSTSVGLFAVQLAKVVGYKVIATCSPRSDDLVKSFGADVTVDYHDVEAAISKIKEVSGGGVVGGLECVGTDDNYRLSINSFKPEGGLLTTLLIIPDEVHNIRKEVKVDRILMYTIGGYSFEFLPGKPPLPAKPEDKEWYQGFRKVTPELISKYGVKANPVEERGGLDSILAGLADLKAGKVSGRKLVYKIA